MSAISPKPVVFDPKFKTIAIDRSHEEHQPCNLSQQLHEILESTLIMHPHVNAVTEISVEPTLNIQTNISLLNRIVSNILSNAFTHAFQDVKIISSTSAPQWTKSRF